jgi:hypothetical protein
MDFQEPGINQTGDDMDPYEHTTPDVVMAYLETVK